MLASVQIPRLTSPGNLFLGPGGHRSHRSSATNTDPGLVAKWRRQGQGGWLRA